MHERGKGGVVQADDDAAWRPPAAAPAAAAEPGTDDILPGFDEPTEIARGGDSIVYRARQRALDRHVAVKVVLVDDPATLGRFEREVEITARLGRQHPNTITVLDTGVTPEGHPAIVMDLVERGSLHDLLVATGPLPVADVLRVGSVIADALSFAHSQGVLHRDVKPQNILVLPTSYVLSDFGISRLADSGHTASVERFSYRHAAPQVLDGHPPTVADDIWSLGSTLHTLLDGRAPFASDDPTHDTALAYLRRARTEEPRPLARNDAPPGLLAVIARCLRKEPAERYATAEELHRALALVDAEARSWAPAERVVGQPVQPITVTEAVTPTQPVEGAERVDPVEVAERVEQVESVEQLESVEPVVTPPAAPAPAAGTIESQPSAPSALAHAPRATTDPDLASPAAATIGDAAPTGLAPGPAPSSTPHPADAGTTFDSTSDSTLANRSRPTGRAQTGRRIAAGLLLGCTVGAAVTVFLVRDRPVATPPSPSTSTSKPASLPIGTATPVVPVPNPRIAPIIENAVDHGTSVEVVWRDRSGGKASFIVIQTRIPTPKALSTALIAPGTTTTNVDVDPKVAQICVQVVAYMGAEPPGLSAERCVRPAR